MSDIEKVKNIVENNKGTLSNKLIDSANKNEESKKKITEVIVEIVQENPEKAVEIIEQNQNTNTVTETIKTKIEMIIVAKENSNSFSSKRFIYQTFH